MTARDETPRILQDAAAQIAQVTAEDRERARRAIAEGVSKAQAQWVEAGLIAEALALELVAVASTSMKGEAIAAQLRSLARRVEAENPTH